VISNIVKNIISDFKEESNNDLPLLSWNECRHYGDIIKNNDINNLVKTIVNEIKMNFERVLKKYRLEHLKCNNKYFSKETFFNNSNHYLKFTHFRFYTLDKKSNHSFYLYDYLYLCVKKRIDNIFDNEYDYIENSVDKNNRKFSGLKKISYEFQKFLNIDKDTLSPPIITKLFYDKLLNSNLIYEKDKRVFRTNSEITKLLGVPESVNNSVDYNDPDGFNFITLQKYLSNIYE
jgi:hypothetical protein